MRRVAVNRLPALAHFFGIRPWDLDRLTAPEIEACIDALDELTP